MATPSPALTGPSAVLPKISDPMPSGGWRFAEGSGVKRREFKCEFLSKHPKLSAYTAFLLVIETVNLLLLCNVSGTDTNHDISQWMLDNPDGVALIQMGIIALPIIANYGHKWYKHCRGRE